MSGLAEAPLTRRISCRGSAAATSESLLSREWLTTNGLGGYACGTLGGVPTRRYHGLLVASLPAPIGRALMLGPLLESVSDTDGTKYSLGGLAYFGRTCLPTETSPSQSRSDGGPDLPESTSVSHCFPLVEFHLEMGLPIWTYELNGTWLEKRILMPHYQNTVLVTYRLLDGPGPRTLELTPTVPFRPYHVPVTQVCEDALEFRVIGERWELQGHRSWPPLRLALVDCTPTLLLEERHFHEVYYREEAARGYEAVGELSSPGTLRLELVRDQSVTLVASTEEWATLDALPPHAAEAAEYERRRRLLAAAGPPAEDSVIAELVLAADQFLIVPAGRVEEAAHIHAEGDEPRSVIAGYHWFTDWGRDTMISLEGLTLTTGRHLEAGYILRTFAHHIRDGLIPNYFPDGDNEGLYHTADATLWFFQALHRYTEVTGDRGTLRILLPKLIEIVACHLRGTRFGIGMDSHDGLLRQGSASYPLTWMDAKMGDWIVTPRRGKAVEINALWYNALCLLRAWTEAEGTDALPVALPTLLEQVRTSFNRRFWNPHTGHLFDVIDGEKGDDPCCRPNQILALALEHPVLDRACWEPVLEMVRRTLLTPVGLRSLAPGHPEYRDRYHGDLRSRDAAYHQGAVWPWLTGPFLDAWLRVYPHDRQGARRWLEGLLPHLGEAGIGSISEIFDGEPPHTPRGCVAQAWSVAEILRSLVKVAG